MEQVQSNLEHDAVNKIYDECISYLEKENVYTDNTTDSSEDSDYETITEKIVKEEKPMFKVENERTRGSIDSVISDSRSERLRKLSQQLPKIIITPSSTNLEVKSEINGKNKHSDEGKLMPIVMNNRNFSKGNNINYLRSDASTLRNNYEIQIEQLNDITADKKLANSQTNVFKHPLRTKKGYASDYPKRLVSKTGVENIALITNVPFEKIRLLNDTFHTLINLRWRWIVIGTIVVHFAIWFVFAVFWYITALAHYDFEPDPPKKTCVTGGKDFVTIFLASVEAQTTIGFGDRAIDEECPESIFLFIMQLILGTGLSGVLTCVVYAKLTRPEKLSRDGVGFSKKAVICMRDGKLCLMMRAWDLNYDHIISSEFTAHFVHTYRTKEGEVIRYYARSLALLQRQFLLWPVTLVHVIDQTSPLYEYSPDLITGNCYEITLSLKGASASMGTFTQSQTSYLPKEVVWGYRFRPVVKYNCRKQKYVIDHKKLDLLEPVDTPYCSARKLDEGSTSTTLEPPRTPGTPSSFSEAVASFQLERSSSFRKTSRKT